jgi:hypothetical protein
MLVMHHTFVVKTKRRVAAASPPRHRRVLATARRSIGNNAAVCVAATACVASLQPRALHRCNRERLNSFCTVCIIRCSGERQQITSTMVDYGIANGDTSMCGRAAPFLANMCALIADICAPFPRTSYLSTANLAPFSLNCTRTAEIRTLNFAVARAGLALSRCRLQSPCAKSSRVPPHRRSGSARSPRPIAAPGSRSAGQALPSLESGLGSPRPHLHWDWAHPAHICTGTGLVSRTSAP